MRFIDTYLVEPAFHTADELYDAVMDGARDGPAHVLDLYRSAYEAARARAQMREIAATRFVWSVRLAERDDDGRIYVAPPGFHLLLEPGRVRVSASANPGIVWPGATACGPPERAADIGLQVAAQLKIQGAERIISYSRSTNGMG
jgi:hypothetical protein